MIRLTYISPATGEQSTEDLIGPSGWGPADYRRVIERRRPGIQILELKRISDDVQPVAISGNPRFHVTLRLPGRPDRTVLTGAPTQSEALREALAEAPPGAAVLAVIPHRQSQNRKLSDDQVRELYRTTEPLRALARRWGVSRTALHQALAGKTHAHLRPDHVPPGQPSCHRCEHWNGEACDLEFPDPIELGPRFAVDCAVFSLRGEVEE
jgi:hypothetical protein